jgi:hypothetical protein
MLSISLATGGWAFLARPSEFYIRDVIFAKYAE